ncbi:hypothetical protein AK812_SmicGene25263 [Symbiodinium microadriaticum]|uniref:Uncharacterized protein n=1 Tax=Symbiodinium microadriaticum TaxID=2951 RepID=A0A1Q9DCT8_SYMMI|nr:hypothetical protein AK812_SmicGene25263 [Symbiodinium microadriaticum]
MVPPLLSTEMTSVHPSPRHPRPVHRPFGCAVSMNPFSRTCKIQTSLRDHLRITAQRRAKLNQARERRAAKPLAIPVSCFLAGGVVPKGLRATTEISRKNPYLRNFFQGFLDKPDVEQAEASRSVGSPPPAACAAALRVPGLQAQSSHTGPGQLLNDSSGYGTGSLSSDFLPEAVKGDADATDMSIGRRH